MAAEDKIGVQHFPHAGFDIPPKEQIEEASAIAQNLLEGQQTTGQGLDDPYTRAVHYLEKHHIVEILQVTMVTLDVWPHNSDRVPLVLMITALSFVKVHPIISFRT